MQFKKTDDEGYTFERDDFSKESQGAKDEESVSRSHQDQDTPQEITIEDVVFYVVRMMLHTEREQFQYQPQQLQQAQH